MTIAVLGEALIDFIAGKDGAYRAHFGGSPYNVAIGLARQGVNVSYLSSLSDDDFGDQIHASLVRERVNMPLTRRSLWPTSLALVNVSENGQPSYRLYREGIADKDTSYEDVLAQLPDGLQLFHTGSLAITPSQLSKVRRLFDLMHERGVLVSVDINIRLRASIDTRKYLDGVLSLLQGADIVKASDEDLATFNLSKSVRKSAQVVYKEMGSGLLVLTEGKGSATLFTDQGVISKRSYPVATLVDTVGSGDTFQSAFLAYLSHNRLLPNGTAEMNLDRLSDALDFACAAAAINVSRAGCSPPTREEVEQFLESARR